MHGLTKPLLSTRSVYLNGFQSQRTFTVEIEGQFKNPDQTQLQKLMPFRCQPHQITLTRVMICIIHILIRRTTGTSVAQAQPTDRR
jgi:hypothetical protein